MNSTINHLKSAFVNRFVKLKMSLGLVLLASIIGHSEIPVISSFGNSAFATTSSINVQSFENRKYVLMGDLEGYYEHLRGLITAGIIVEKVAFNGDKTYHLANPDMHLVFTGDLLDREGKSIESARQILSLFENHPDNIHVILGNRDGNKLGLLQFVQGVEDLRSAHKFGQDGIDYIIWLKNKALASVSEDSTVRDRLQSANTEYLNSHFNTEEMRVKFYLEKIGASQSLTFFKNEMIEMTNNMGAGSLKNETDAVFAKLYIKELRQGSIGKLLRKATGAYYDDTLKMFVSHGGISPQSFLIDPTTGEKLNNVNAFVDAVNRMVRTSIVEID